MLQCTSNRVFYTAVRLICFLLFAVLCPFTRFASAQPQTTYDPDIYFLCRVQVNGSFVNKIVTVPLDVPNNPPTGNGTFVYYPVGSANRDPAHVASNLGGTVCCHSQPLSDDSPVKIEDQTFDQNLVALIEDHGKLSNQLMFAGVTSGNLLDRFIPIVSDPRVQRIYGQLSEMNVDERNANINKMINLYQTERELYRSERDRAIAASPDVYPELEQRQHALASLLFLMSEHAVDQYPSVDRLLVELYTHERGFNRRARVGRFRSVQHLVFQIYLCQLASRRSKAELESAIQSIVERSGVAIDGHPGPFVRQIIRWSPTSNVDDKTESYPQFPSIGNSTLARRLHESGSSVYANGTVVHYSLIDEIRGELFPNVRAFHDLLHFLKHQAAEFLQ